MIGDRRIVGVGALFAYLAIVSATSAAVFDNFEAYRTGTVLNTGDNVTAGAWKTLPATGAAANAALQAVSGNLVLSVGNTGNSHAWRNLTTNIDDTDTATTVFMRVRANQANPNGSFGLSDNATPTDPNNFGDFEAQFRLFVDTGVMELQARNGAAFQDLVTPITQNQWYNVWMVINNSANTWDAYVSTTAATATISDLVGTGLAFRNGAAANPLTTFLAYGGAGSVLGSNIDDIHISAGTVLTNFATGDFVLGDVTGEGNVNINDFIPIRDNLFNTGMNRVQGDLTRNGIVDFVDFREWKDAAVGAGMAIGDLTFDQIAALIPEPSTTCLALMACVAGWTSRARRRSA